MTKKKSAKTFSGSTEQKDRSLSNDQKAEVMELFLTDPESVIERIAKDENFPIHAVRRLIERLKTRSVGTVAALRQYTAQGFISDLKEKAQLALDNITQANLSEASPKDLAIIVGILTEKSQLLEGRPTSILSFEERLHIRDLLPALAKEAARRGMFLDATAVTISETNEQVPLPKVIPKEDQDRVAIDRTYNHIGRQIEQMDETS